MESVFYISVVAFERNKGDGVLVLCCARFGIRVIMEDAGGAIVEKNNFARKLGSTDKKTREKGLSLLVLWLSCQKVSCCVSLLFFPYRLH